MTRLPMRLLPLLAAALLATPAAAQLRSLELTFKGIGCQSCAGSLPTRIQRLRGVESARVDATKQVLSVKFAPVNRIRLEQIRDAVEQDGARVTQAALTVEGILAEESARWLLNLPNGAQFEISLDGAPPSAQYSLKPGPASVQGLATDLHPKSGPIVITAKSAASTNP
jgi:copper chaperone CopZ